MKKPLGIVLILSLVCMAGCSRPLAGELVNDRELGRHSPVKLTVNDDYAYKPTYSEAVSLVFQCGGKRLYGDCDDNARRCAQRCRDRYNDRAKSIHEKGLACWVTKGLWKGEWHASVVFLTVDKGFRHFDAQTKRDITDEFVLVSYMEM